MVPGGVVEGIAEEEMADGGDVDSDLVRAAAVEGDFEGGGGGGAGDDGGE